MDRKKRAIKNVLTNLGVQIILAFAGLLIPRLIMQYYGSEMNGLVSSISQFISYAALIEMGIANASIIALYKPIADNEYHDISSVIAGAKKMYLISAYIYTAIVMVIALLYPRLYLEQLDYSFVCWLVLCIGSVNAIDYYLLGKYKVLLIADQKYYVINFVRILATILLIAVSIILLLNEVSLLFVKAVPILTHFIEAILIVLYVKKYYKSVNFKCKHTLPIPQRWNALIHQVCSTITYNTDLVVLTLCLPGRSLLEISVYSVYAMVLSLLTNITGSLTTGINATFGNMMANGETSRIRKTFDIYEYLYFCILFFLYSCFATLILPFVSCYTKGLDDVKYVRLSVGVLFALNGLFAQLKEVSGVIINAAGRYKETQRYAIEEATINIAVSLLLVGKLGIEGVLIGTLVSHVWMDFRFISYMEKNIIVGIEKATLTRIIRNSIIFSTLVFTELNIMNITQSWGIWLLWAVLICVVNILIFALVNGVCESDNAHHVLTNIIDYTKKNVRR